MSRDKTADSRRFVWQGPGVVLRLGEKADAEGYFQQNYCPLDPEIAYFTGCKPVFSQEEVVSFFRACVEDPHRYDFLLVCPDGRILGECVINEIDWELKKANYRIALFQKEARNRGLGTWATERIRDFAFRELKLHRLELEVYAFNPRGRRVYEKAGFQVEGILRDAVQDGQGYADVIVMAMLEQDWNTIVRKDENKHG